MPLTFAHPIAVVPPRRLGLPLAALAVGSMIPDVVLFAPWLPVSYEQTHSLVGLVTIDVVLGVVAWVAWQRLLREPLANAARPPCATGSRRRARRPGGWYRSRSSSAR